MYKKILIFLFLAHFIPNKLFSQTLVKDSVLTKKAWIDVFRQNFGLDTSGMVNFTFQQKTSSSFLPERWEYTDSSECEDCDDYPKTYYYGLSSNSFFLVANNNYMLGTYILFFDTKNKHKTWMQLNSPANNVVFYKINANLAYFELTHHDEMYVPAYDYRRYVFVNPMNGKIANTLITIADTAKISISAINIAQKTVTISIDNEKNKSVILDYEKMEFNKKNNFPKNNFQKTYFDFIKLKY